MNTAIATSVIKAEIPKIIHFSVPAVMSADDQRRIEAARWLHPDWNIKVWKDPLDPAGFRLAHLWKSTTSGAHLSDLIRLEVVYRYGGFYFDNDFIFHKPLEPLRHNSFVICSEDGHNLTNAFFGATQSNAALGLLISQLEKLKAFPPDTRANVSTGPVFFARLLRWNKDITVVPRELFYPYNWNEPPTANSPAGIATHLWAGSWSDGGGKNGKRKNGGSKKRGWSLRNGLKDSIKYIAGRWTNINETTKTYAMTEDVMITTAHGYYVIASGRDLSITPHLAKDGYYERSDELFIKSIVRGGDWCIDVGANVGVFSLLFAARVGPFGRVFAFEPNPLTRHYLERSAILNWVHDRLTISSAAVGAMYATETMHFTPDRLGDAVVGGSTDMQRRVHDFAHFAIESISVEQISLDSFFPDWAFFTCVKIDVEGKEPNVLRGARRLFSEGRIACLIIECLQEIGEAYFDELTNELRHLGSLGYVSGHADSNGVFHSKTLENLIDMPPGRNWIFIHSAYIARLTRSEATPYAPVAKKQSRTRHPQ